MLFNIPNEVCFTSNQEEKNNLPKYATQLINLANQNAQGTRPKNVGQLTELFTEYLDNCENNSEDGWKEFYLEQHPKAVKEATHKIYKKIKEQRKALRELNKSMVRQWVEDLIFHKTYEGLYVQEKILEILAKQQNSTYRLATRKEEKKGIDGFIGDVPYSIKPTSYKAKPQLLEVIDAKRVFYTKTKKDIKVEVED